MIGIKTRGQKCANPFRVTAKSTNIWLGELSKNWATEIRLSDFLQPRMLCNFPIRCNEYPMSITLNLPNNIHEALRVSPAEAEQRLKLELAIVLYTQNALSLGKAATLAGLDRFELNRTLAQRGIPMHYGEPELQEDLKYLGNDQQHSVQSAGQPRSR